MLYIKHCLLILTLFITMCEIWFSGLTYSVYLILSLKTGCYNAMIIYKLQYSCCTSTYPHKWRESKHRHPIGISTSLFMSSSINCSFWSNSDVTDNSTVQLTDWMLTLCWHRLPREYKLTASCLQVTHNRTLAFKHLNWTADGHTCYKPRNVNSCHVYHVNNHWTPTALSTNNTLLEISAYPSRWTS